MKKLNYLILSLGILALTATSCGDPDNGQGTDSENNQEAVQDSSQSADAATAEKVVYEADLTALNSKITGAETTGKARFVIDGEVMHVTIDVKNAPANMEHWQHFHGFKDGSAATCANAEQDKNGDGIVDVVETESVSGTTMVPFNDIPADMDVASDTYPVSDSNGTYHYEADIPMENLKSAFTKAFGGDINLDSRVLYIHGVPKDTELPKTVATIADIPAQVTIPIACGKINKVSE